MSKATTTLKIQKVIEPTFPNKPTQSFGGESSGFLNWNDTRYPYLYEERNNLRGLFWQANEIDMSGDIKQYPTLEPRLKEAFLRNIGMLATLDAPQTTIAKLISDYASDPAITTIFATIADQEGEHNHSYSYVLATLETYDKQTEVFEIGRTNEALLKRNKRLTKIYNEAKLNPTPKNMARAIVHSLILEGLRFYSGFAFFYGLARRSLMVNTSMMISYINREELQHGRIMADILLILLREYPELNNKKFIKWIYKEFRLAVQEEKDWVDYNMEGVEDIYDRDEMFGFLEFRANKMLRSISLDEIFEENTENPMLWVTSYVDNFDNTKTNFFEGKNRQYVKANNDNNGFDDL